MSSPASVDKATCVTCHKVLDASWAFCPACGADNRDPALHKGPVGRHDHDYSLGFYCVLCGHSSGSSADRIVFARDTGLRVGGVFCILCGSVFPLCALAFGWFHDPAIPKFVEAFGLTLFALVFGLLGVYMLFAESTIIFDFKAGTLTLKRGLTLAPKVETTGFDQFSGFKLTSWQRPREVTPTWYLYLVRRNGREILISTYSWESRMRAGAEGLTHGTGLPLDDQS